MFAACELRALQLTVRVLQESASWRREDFDCEIKLWGSEYVSMILKFNDRGLALRASSYVLINAPASMTAVKLDNDPGMRKKVEYKGRRTNNRKPMIKRFAAADC
jgi:hypothetical protein